jgi:TonB-like protein
MKKSVIVLLFNILGSTVFAQLKDFEGIMTYRVAVQSKSELISSRAIMNMLATGNTLTIAIKHGNYRQSSGITDSYFISKDQKVYLKFKGVDTLYYLDYNSDTTTVTQVSRSDEQRNIAGAECRLLIVKLGSITRKYYYAPAIYMNPDYDKNNTIGRYDVFSKETSSLYLGFEEENKSYSLSENCVRFQQTAVDDSVFALPDLPRKKFSAEELVVQPEFTRSGGWEKYAGGNLDGKVAAKYLKVPKGEEMVSQQVIVMFMVNENGKVVSAEVINKKDVHPKLAEEALRVVNESPLWKPATFFGGKITWWVKAPITFEVTK